MTLSNETKTTLSRTLVKEMDELYPDRNASDNEITESTATTWVLPDTVPKTTDDMSLVFKWTKGSADIKGTHAKANQAMAGYRRDIESAPDQNDYKPIYYDTFKTISSEIKKWKR